MYFLSLCLAIGLPFIAAAAGPNGADNGWAIDNSGNPLLTSAVAGKLSKGETGWIRIEMRLIPGHATWDAAMLGYYDVAVNNARGAGLQVLLLIDGGSWPGGQTAWTNNNAENISGGNGDNAYVAGFATNAALVIVQHFRDRVKYFELWNEPNCWSSNPAPGVFTGCTYLYPSNYGWLLARTWEAVHQTAQIKDVTLFSGGVFGHSIGNVYSYANAGAQYIDDTYKIGLTNGGAFSHIHTNYNAYPLDGVGQHLYIDQGGLTTSNRFRQYLDWVRQAYTKYEGSGTPKRSFITEFGWTTTSVNQSVQNSNLVFAFNAIQAAPYLQTAIWFNWEDNVAASLYYGVLDSTETPKLSYSSYQNFQRYQGMYSNGIVNAGISNYYSAFGQPLLGNPYDNGRGPWVYAVSGAGVQNYDGGTHLKLLIAASTNGTFEVNDLHGLSSYYLTNNGAGIYGLPIDNEFAFGSGTRQDFTGGYLTWTPPLQIMWHASSAVPAAPPGLTASSRNHQVALAWGSSTQATSYNLKRSISDGGPYTTIATRVTGATVFTDVAVTNDVTYFYVVSAVNSFGESADSVQSSCTPNDTAQNLPLPWQERDIGAVGVAGNAAYNSGSFAVAGSGADIGGTSDAFHFLEQPMSGNGVIIARVTAQLNTDLWAKSGVAIRDSLNSNAAGAMVLVTPGHGVRMQYRASTGGGSTDVTGPASLAPLWLKLVRTGNVFTGYASSDGVAYTQILATNLPNIGSNAFAGMAVCSHTNGALNTSSFDNVSVTPPAPSGVSAQAGDSQVFVTWYSLPGATSYKLKRALASSGPYAILNGSLTQTNFLDDAVTNGLTYYYVVSAMNSALEGPNSAPSGATPLAPAPMIFSYDGTNLVISWTDARFQLQGATNVTGPFTDLTGMASPFMTNAMGNQYFRLRY